MIIQVRDCGGFNRMVFQSGEKWSDFEYTLKAESSEFSYRSDVGRERQRGDGAGERGRDGEREIQESKVCLEQMKEYATDGEDNGERSRFGEVKISVLYMLNLSCQILNWSCQIGS